MGALTLILLGCLVLHAAAPPPNRQAVHSTPAPATDQQHAQAAGGGDQQQGQQNQGEDKQVRSLAISLHYCNCCGACSSISLHTRNVSRLYHRLYAISERTSLAYSRLYYTSLDLEQVIKILESDEKFRERIKTMKEDDIKVGHRTL